MSWASILILAGGAYLFKAVGLLVLGPLLDRSEARPTADGPQPAGGWPLQLGQLLPPALLAALVVNQTVVSGQELVLDARLAGVATGAVAVWRGAPFWLVLVISAATTALLRLVAGEL
jgi:hypothetical protein